MTEFKIGDRNVIVTEQAFSVGLNLTLSSIVFTQFVILVQLLTIHSLLSTTIFRIWCKNGTVTNLLVLSSLK